MPLLLAGGTIAIVPGSGPASAAAPVCDGRQATIVGTERADRLTGTAGRDVIVGLGGNDVISGRRGGDLLCGNDGSDVIEGGGGGDRLFGGDDSWGDDVGGSYLQGDVLRGGSGNDLLAGGWDDRTSASRRIPDTYSWSDAPRGVAVDLSRSTGIATGHGHDRLRVYKRTAVTGSPYADRIIGSDYSDTIQGGDGGDQISGGPGRDQLLAERRGGTGNDLVHGGADADLIGSYAGRDRLRGDRGNDFVEAYGEGATSVRGGSGSDQVAQMIPRQSGLGSVGDSGRDVVTLYGRPLHGSSPRARFRIDLRSGETSSDQGGAGRGRIGGYEEYRLVGNLRWWFNGSAANDRVWAITGGELQAWTYGGRDWIRGSARNDSINGGQDSDAAFSGGGSDVCRSVERGNCR